MTVRDARVADVDALMRVRLAVRENRLSSPGRVTAQDCVVAITEIGRGWVAEVDGEIVGFAIGYLSGEVWALFVHPDHEGQGHGSALHAVLVDWLRDNAPGRAWLRTGTGTRAERFYREHGWVDCGVDASGERRFERSFVERHETAPA